MCKSINAVIKPTINDVIEDFDSDCCNTGIYRKSAQDYRCQNCDSDVTLDLFYILESFY